MLSLKTSINPKELNDFMFKYFQTKNFNMLPLSGGEFSQVFIVKIEKKDLVLRINTSIKDYLKEKFAYENFASDRIPIPKIIDVGQVNSEYCYSLSEKAEGVTYDNLSNSQQIKLLPNLALYLDNIRDVDISNKKGYGDFDKNGTAHFDSWKNYLLSINSNDDIDWEKIFKATYFTKEIFEKIYTKLRSLASFSPEKRYLVHSDYGYSNVLINKENVTGIIDWAYAKYGDFLYDVAWLDLWSSDKRYLDFFKNHLSRKNVNLDNFEERIKVYQLHQGIGGLEFFAKSNRKENFNWLVEKLLK